MSADAAAPRFWRRSIGGTRSPDRHAYAKRWPKRYGFPLVSRTSKLTSSQKNFRNLRAPHRARFDSEGPRGELMTARRTQGTPWPGTHDSERPLGEATAAQRVRDASGVRGLGRRARVARGDGSGLARAALRNPTTDTGEPGRRTGRTRRETRESPGGAPDERGKVTRESPGSAPGEAPTAMPLREPGEAVRPRRRARRAGAGAGRGASFECCPVARTNRGRVWRQNPVARGESPPDSRRATPGRGRRSSPRARQTPRSRRRGSGSRGR
ncbi:hypothetical protein SAURM35S_08803 [Streptomyces aurantiogriseus]